MRKVFRKVFHSWGDVFSATDEECGEGATLRIRKDSALAAAVEEVGFPAKITLSLHPDCTDFTVERDLDSTTAKGGENEQA